MSTTPAARPAKGRSRIAAWADHHSWSIVASLGRMLRRPWATLLTVGVMGVALALPLGLWLVLDNAARLAGNVEQSREVAVFLDPGLPVARAQALAGELRARADVAAVTVKTPDDGLAALRAAGGWDAALEVVGENPLPSVLEVLPRGDEAALVEALRALPEADVVQHDALWRERLGYWLGFGERVAWVLAVLLVLGALLVVGNTVRLDIQSRRDEIGVMQLLGATDGFIRRPFLYLGAWYGLGAGALALALLTAAELALRGPLQALASSYGSQYALQGVSLVQVAVVLVGAALLGWLGAGVVTGHFLRQARAG